MRKLREYIFFVLNKDRDDKQMENKICVLNKEKDDKQREKIMDLLLCCRKVYSIFMLVVIIISIAPLTVKHPEKYVMLSIAEYVCAAIFIVEYFLRWITVGCTKDKDIKTVIYYAKRLIQDILTGKKEGEATNGQNQTNDTNQTNQGADKGSWKMYVKYPFSVMAIIDLLSIIPAFTAINKAAILGRWVRFLKLVRILKLFRYPELEAFVDVLKAERNMLYAVFNLIVFYILFIALLIFNVEQDNFRNFYEALYWATGTFTSGFGALHSEAGIPAKFVAMISSLIGIVLLAIPKGTIISTYLKKIKQDTKKDKNCDNCKDYEKCWKENR